MNTFEFSTCSSLVCGIGAIDELPSRLKSLGVTKALIVTDPGLLSTGIVAQACDSLAASDMPFTIYSDVQADPPEAVVLSAAAFARDQQIDGVRQIRRIRNCIQIGLKIDSLITDLSGDDNIHERDHIREGGL